MSINTVEYERSGAGQRQGASALNPPGDRPTGPALLRGEIPDPLADSFASAASDAFCNGSVCTSRLALFFMQPLPPDIANDTCKGRRFIGRQHGDLFRAAPSEGMYPLPLLNDHGAAIKHLAGAQVRVRIAGFDVARRPVKAGPGPTGPPNGGFANLQTGTKHSY
jgi:hypothetical protein